MLVGRESEIQAIAGVLASARVGASRVLVLTGEPGIGKTALLAHAESSIGAMRPLRARGLETEQVVPFAGLLETLRPLLDLLDEIPAPQVRALSSALLLDSRSGAEPSRFAVGAATLSLLSRAAEEQPLAVLLDDAHWLDRPSAEALVFAARRLGSDAVAMLAAVRPDAPGAALWSALPALDVRGLDPTAAAALVRSATGSIGDGQLATLHRATAGNPLALLELSDRADELAALPAGSAMPVSERVSQAFLGQAERLEDETRLVLLVAAADSASATTVFDAAARLGVAAPRLTEAEDAGLVALANGRVEFRHPLVRSAVYGAADPERRRAVHRALAEVVPRDQTDRLAWHLARGAVRPDESTAVVLDQVAGEAAARGAHAIAALAHERAADLSDTALLVPRRLAAAGEAAWLAGLTGRGVALLDRAMAAQPEPRLRAQVLAVRGAVETRCGSLGDALNTYVEAASAVGNTDDDQAIRIWADAVHVAFYLLAPDSLLLASRHIEELLGRSHDSATHALGMVAAGMAQVLSGAGAEGIQRLRVAVPQLVVRDDELERDQFRLPLLVQGALWLRDSGRGRTVLTSTIDRLRDRAALGSLPYLLMHVARDAAASDRWLDAETAYLESIRLARETGQTTDLAMSLAGLAMLDARRGRVAQCRAGAAEAEVLSTQNSIRLVAAWLTFARGDAAAGTGDLIEAAARYEELLRLLADSRMLDPDQSCAPELIEVLVHRGRLAEARAVITDFTAAATAKGHPWSLARAERAQGLCETGSAAEPHFRAALELHGQTPDRYEHARTELAFGAWLRRERRRAEARPVLAGALATFDELGAVPWAERAARELRATGVTAQRRMSATVELTPQERQIAQLLASGRTTREAAAALFLSPKTVEYHLRHVYQKLGIRSRADLVTAMGARPGQPSR